RRTCSPSTSGNVSPRSPSRGRQLLEPTVNMSSAPSSTRQTLSYLRGLFAARGIKPKKKLGQNFLIDLNLLDLLLRAAELTRDDLALEVGSGTGSLTVRLVEQAGAV